MSGSNEGLSTDGELQEMVREIREENSDRDSIGTGLRILAQAYGHEAVGLPPVVEVEAAVDTPDNQYFAKI